MPIDDNELTYEQHQETAKKSSKPLKEPAELTYEEHRTAVRLRKRRPYREINE